MTDWDDIIVGLNQVIGGLAFLAWALILWREVGHARGNGGMDPRMLAMLYLLVFVSAAWFLQALIAPLVDSIRIVGMAARMALLVIGITWLSGFVERRSEQ